MVAYPYSLHQLNTFNIAANCSSLLQLAHTTQLQEVCAAIKKWPQHLVLGGGSNVLFTKNYNGLVIKNDIKGIALLHQNNEHVYIQAMAGENWHNFVMYCVNNNYGGIENLALIPGTVGAAPIQNIGAYGAEVKNSIHEVHYYDIATNKTHLLTNSECMFGYRDSVFKHALKNKIIITAVTFKLNKHSTFNTSYGAITQQLKIMNATPTLHTISAAVIAIRESKLPNPAITGNAGSFFKNPVVSTQVFNALITTYPQLPNYPNANGVKLAAGWLIEQCGLKGYTHNGAQVHAKQALVLINYANATGTAVLELAQYVQHCVHTTFGVMLETEVTIL